MSYLVRLTAELMGNKITRDMHPPEGIEPTKEWAEETCEMMLESGCDCEVVEVQ